QIAEDPPETISISVSTGSAEENHVLTATPVISDSDTADLGQGTVNYAWQVSNDGISGWTTVQSGADNTYTPGEAQDGKFVQVVATYTDVEGHSTQGTSTPTQVAED